MNKKALSFTVAGLIVGLTFGFVLEAVEIGGIIGLVVGYVVYQLRKKDDL